MLDLPESFAPGGGTTPTGVASPYLSPTTVGVLSGTLSSASAPTATSATVSGAVIRFSASYALAIFVVGLVGFAVVFETLA